MTIRKTPRSKVRRRQALFAYAMLIPSATALLLFLVWPFIQGASKAFFKYNGGNVDIFVGFDNFVRLFSDPLFFLSLRNGLLLTAVWMVQAVVVPLWCAWMVHHFTSERLKYTFRVLVMLPVMVPTVVVFLLWIQFLATDGAVNRVLEGVGLGAFTQSWLGDPNTVLVGLLLVGFPWLGGINCLLYLAAFGNIPKELYEAGALDGARAGVLFRKVEYPFVAPQTRIILVITLVAGLQNYENVFIMTHGGPADASVVPGILLFRNAFAYGQFGYATAIGLATVAVILLIVGAALLVRRLVGGRNAD
ncbi:carbohydrate ABC transporter permease [uncultured Microbacterium sp.]|uniref:carbohydrate ABC transporter permease n=1 Tax=uncultured Microbacterium sp. TaxID=191216 RepID=UPI0035CACC0A